MFFRNELLLLSVFLKNLIIYLGIKNLNTLIVSVNTKIPDISIHLEYNVDIK